MSDQAQGGNSGLMHCNTYVPKLENVDVYNGHDQGFITTTSGQSLLPSSAGDNVGFKSEISIKSNPVGSLQELCIARRFPLPIYTFSDGNLNVYNERFKVTCSIYTYISTGTGFYKQGAKYEAAYLMYKQLEKLTSEDLHKIIDNECEYKDETHNNTPFLCHESTTLLKIFFGQNIEKYSNEFKLTAADTLKKISKRENFTFNCVKISQNSDKVEVLMQVNTTPVIVISKSGKNVNDAQESAAYVVLTYLKLKLNI